MKALKIIFPVLLLSFFSIAFSACAEDEVLTQVDGDERPVVPGED